MLYILVEESVNSLAFLIIILKLGNWNVYSYQL